MNTLSPPIDIDAMVDGIDPCLQSPECTDIRDDTNRAIPSVDELCDGIDACLQSPECTDIQS